MHALVLVLTLTSTPLQDWADKKDKEALLPILKEYWITLGVMDKGEWRFSSVYTLDGDIDTMNWRLENVPADAPTVAALHHLPDSYTASKAYRQAHEYIRHLQQVREWLIEGEETCILDWLIAETERRKDIWWQVYCCTSLGYSREGRRWELNELRKKVGAEMFYGGNWPEPLPPHAHYWNWRLEDDIDPDN